MKFTIVSSLGHVTGNVAGSYLRQDLDSPAVGAARGRWSFCVVPFVVVCAGWWGQLSLYFSDDDEVDGGEQPDELIEPGRILISEFRSDHYPLMARVEAPFEGDSVSSDSPVWVVRDHFTRLPGIVCYCLSYTAVPVTFFPPESVSVKCNVRVLPSADTTMRPLEVTLLPFLLVITSVRSLIVLYERICDGLGTDVRFSGHPFLWVTFWVT
jgi:hypothetical protein